LGNQFYVEIIPPDEETGWYTLPENGEVIFGRSKRSSEVVLNDPRISRVHLRVTTTEDRGVVVTDLFSANGTRLEGRRLKPGVPITWLVDQRIALGHTRLILHYGAPPA
jgi:pSer/pThr/pTyr-binding forkhead associated (FHA) protein